MTIKVTYNVTDVYMSQSVSPVYINVSYSDGGASGGGVWGSITGTLSNQTDLQTALDAKLDESTIDGGTEGQILSKASATDFDFAWINNYAKYLATNVRNQTGTTINAFQVVYISGATGNKPLISLADADTEATSSKTYGVTATAISNNGTGDVVTAGELSGINTSAFNEGDLLWLSTTAGGVVTTPPAEPAHSVFIGYVVRSHPTLGVIDVAIANGYELNELHGVQITTATDNQGLFYNATSTLWENKSITTALGYTPANAATTLTINGVTFDLSTSRTWTISAGISGSGAAGQVTYWTGASAVSGSNNLFWDNTNSRLGIGTNTPSGRLHVLFTNFADVAIFERTPIFTNALAASSILRSGYAVSPSTGAGPSFAFQLRVGAVVTDIAAFGAARDGADNSGYLSFATINAGTQADKMQIRANGNVLIQNGGTFSDGGQRLQVIGDTLLRGSGATSATTALTVQNSSSTNLFTVRNDGNVGIGTNAPSKIFEISRSIGVNDGIRMTNTGGGYFQITNSSGSAFQPIFEAQGSGNVSSMIFKGLQTATGSPTATVMRFVSRASDDSSPVSGVNAMSFENGTTVGFSLSQNNSLLVGTGTDVASSILTMASTTKGFLPPRMTTTQKNAITSPAAGLVVYDTTLNKLCVYTTAWETITSI